MLMQVTNDNISFQSKIKFISYKDFTQKVSALNKKKHYVTYPWTPDTMKKGKNLYTDNIMDCIAGGVVDGGKVVMFHICTRTHNEALRTRQRGFDVNEIKRRISEKVDLANKNLHAFILGGFQMGEKSMDNSQKLNKMVKIFENLEIPCTVIGGRCDTHIFGRYGMFYENKSDTFFITNTHTVAKSHFGMFPAVEVKPNGNILYDLFRKNESALGPKYFRTRKYSDAKEYLKNQFKMFYVSKFDEFV